jgi:probable rRNA maturation factor
LASPADVRIDDDGWCDVIADLETVCHDALSVVFAVLDKPPAGVGFLFTDDRAVQALNATYRSQDKPTNVLSFPCDPSALPPDQPAYLGDVALARETVLAEAAAQGKSATAHSHHLIIHGALHLLGHDHVDPAEAETMEALERAILARLGYGDPYIDAAEAETE